MLRIPYIIGDLHGCYHEMQRLEKKIYEHAARHHWSPLFISVGDLIDRGPDSSKIIEHFRNGFIAGTHLSVCGNHEMEFLRQIESLRPDFWDNGLRWPRFIRRVSDDLSQTRQRYARHKTLRQHRSSILRSWLKQGGTETLLSYDCHPDYPDHWDFPNGHLDFMVSMPLIWEDSSVIVTHALAHLGDLNHLRQQQHAGLLAPLPSPEGSVQSEDKSIRNAAISLLWSRLPPDGRLHPYKTHISGHTPLKRPGVSQQHGLIQLDTGCVYGQYLTAWCPQTESFIFEPSVTRWTRPAK